MTLGGLAWAVLLLATLNTAPVAVAVVVSPVAVIAVVSAWRRATRTDQHEGEDPGVAPSPTLLFGSLGALGLAPLAAVAGPVAVVVWLLAGGAVLAWQTMHQRPAVLRRGLIAALLPAIAGASIVLADRQGVQVALVFIGAYCLFDVANAAMGTGPTGGVVGAVSGLLTVVVLAVIVRTLLSPPFTGSSPWLLCGAFAVLAPTGVWICGRLAPGRLPALRRLDSLVLAGPVWVIGVAVLLPH